MEGKEMALLIKQAMEEKRPIVVLDIETTGFSSIWAKIIEIGAVKLMGREQAATYSTFLNPGCKISPKITKITGITNEMVRDKPRWEDELPRFYEFMKDAVIVCHNASFDWNRFLQNFLFRLGIKANNPVVDTIVLSKYYFPNETKHSLEDLCQRLGIERQKSHRALHDAADTAKILLSLYDKFIVNEKGGEVLSFPPPKKSLGIIKIKRVRYWEKQITPKRFYQRIYVTTNRGTVYYDIPSATWYNKDCEEGVDMEKVKAEVLKYLNLSSEKELANYIKHQSNYHYQC